MNIIFFILNHPIESLVAFTIGVFVVAFLFWKKQRQKIKKRGWKTII